MEGVFSSIQGFWKGLSLSCSDVFPFRQNHKNSCGVAEGYTTGGSQLRASVLTLVDP